MVANVAYLAECKPGDTCINGIPCLNGHCSTSCTVSTDCLGWGTGINGYGVQCLIKICSPAGEQKGGGNCNLDTDCKGWGSGTGGVNAKCNSGVCSVLPASYTGPNTGCLGNDNITSYVCIPNGDPKTSCDPSSATPPTGILGKPVGWLTCALGSSPGGSTSGRAATSCLNPITGTFGCTYGEECYAVTNIDKGNAACIASNPATTLSKIGNTYLGFYQSINGLISGTGDALSQPYIWIAAAIIGIIVIYFMFKK